MAKNSFNSQVKGKKPGMSYNGESAAAAPGSGGQKESNPSKAKDKPKGKLANPMKDSGSNDAAKANENLYKSKKMSTVESNSVAKAVNKKSPGRKVKDSGSNTAATKVNRAAGKGF